MKIISRTKKDPYKFITLKSIWDNGKLVKAGEQIEILEQADQDGMVKLGQVKPADLPEVGRYVALRDLTLPGKVEKFTAKRLELIELKGADALLLMLDRGCLPADPDQWRPYRMKLGAPKRNYSWEKSMDDAGRTLAAKKTFKNVGLDYPSQKK
jgi:hypothetical protein